MSPPPSRSPPPVVTQPAVSMSEMETISEEDEPAAVGEAVLDPGTTGHTGGERPPHRDVVRLEMGQTQLRWDTSANWVSLVVIGILVGGLVPMQLLDVVAIAWLWANR